MNTETAFRILLDRGAYQVSYLERLAPASLIALAECQGVTWLDSLEGIAA